MRQGHKAGKWQQEGTKYHGKQWPQRWGGVALVQFWESHNMNISSFCPRPLSYITSFVLSMVCLSKLGPEWGSRLPIVTEGMRGKYESAEYGGAQLDPKLSGGYGSRIVSLRSACTT